jgi:ATP-dependent helicase/nuclease subunit B
VANIYSIPPEINASEAFATWFHAQSFKAPESVLVFVPNRRLAREISAQLAQHAPTHASALPIVMPLGALDRVQMLRIMKNIPHLVQALLEIPPVLDNASVLHQLVRQISALQLTRDHGGNMEQALHHAQALMHLLETSATYGTSISRERILNLVTGDFAKHWQESAEFLAIIECYFHHEEGILAAREQFLLAQLWCRYFEAAPNSSAIAFGSSGSIPYVRQLLQHIAALPNGYVMLPGIDNKISEPDWQQIGAGHAQYHIKTTLEAMGAGLAQLHDFAAKPKANNILSSGFTPYDTVHETKPFIHSIKAANSEEEARIIALLLRETLEHPAKTALVITPDIGLMRRIAASMAVYGICPDSPPLTHRAHRASGRFILQWQRCMAAPDDAIALRGFLEHESIMADHHRETYEAWLNIADIKVFRGKSNIDFSRIDADAVLMPLQRWLAVERASATRRHSLTDWLSKLQNFCLVAELPENIRQEIAAYCNELSDITVYYPALEADEMLALWRQYLTMPNDSEAPLAPHPRLRMLTPIEARLAYADRVILASFHAESWGSVPVSPWLNQKQTELLGLPSLHAQQSLTAHDVWMHCHAPEIYITHPVAINGKPSTAHALYHKLEPWMQTENTEHHIIRLAHIRRCAGHYTPIQPTSPTPEASARPRNLRVSSLDQLFLNPYAIYAQYILQLSELDDYGTINEAAVFGKIAHKLMEDAYKGTVIDAAYIQRSIAKYQPPKSLQNFWNTRLHCIRAFAQREQSLVQAQGDHVQSEHAIEATLNIPAMGGIALNGRIDAKITHSDKRIMLIDFKTGGMPSKPDIATGRACQLTAYGIMEHTLGAQWPAEIQYVKLPDIKNDVQRLSVSWSNENWQEHAEQLFNALAAMLDPQTPFLAHPIDNKEYESRRTEYDGISRAEEWQ